MRVLILHNRYRHPGGEDTAARSEAAMLRKHGMDVAEHHVDNDVNNDVDSHASKLLGNVALLARSAWSRDSYASVRRICQEFRPAIVHVHNFWMRLTPSVHAAAHSTGAATVQSLHNYRLVCGNGFLLRDGKICEDCLGAAPWRGVVHRCYHNSVIASAAVARMIAHNRSRQTWTRDVDAFITPSESARTRLLRAGLPAERFFVKPNFTEDPGVADYPPSASRRFVFAGRLSEEKGVRVLIAAWARVKREGAQLIIAGDGPQRCELENYARDLGLRPSDLVFAGRLPPADLIDSIKTARAVVLPSICLETFGSIIVEAFSCGRPAIVSDLGSPSELVRDGWNGYKAPPSDAVALARSLEVLLANDALADEMGRNSRYDFVTRFTPHVNFETLSTIYGFALRHKDTRYGPAGNTERPSILQDEEVACRV
ncbi:MAG: glycosyltransferase family 4 protein [Acidobacteriota bacterium]|nr:glycosyltransferase family 4 protein [Acidobacteriota bacterium]